MDDYLPLAEQIKLLFDSVRHEDGRPFTLQEVSSETGISLGTISQMRSGMINNPQLNTLRALCRFFQVPLRYFETKTPAECYALLITPSRPEKPALHEIAFRASGLTPEAQHDILTLIKVFQEEEKRRLENQETRHEDDEDENGNSD
ncbi:MAG: helix-turn-helix transcriptional regulator [Chloroflexota bacterium]